MALVQCPSCRKNYRVGDDLVGKKVRCRECGSVFVMESADNPQPQAKEPPPAAAQPPPDSPPPPPVAPPPAEPSPVSPAVPPPGDASPPPAVSAISQLAAAARPATPWPISAPSMPPPSHAAPPAKPLWMPPLPPRPLPGSRTLGPGSVARALVAGLMLLTIIVPWVIEWNSYSDTTEVLFSWDIFRGAPSMVIVMFVMLWLVAAGTVAVGLALRGQAESFAQAGLGALGILMTMIAINMLSTRFPIIMLPAAETTLTLLMVYGVFAMLWLIACHVRLGVGPLVGARLAQGAAAGLALLILLAVGIVAATAGGTDHAYHSRSVHETSGREVLGVVFSVLMMVAVLAAYVVSIVDAAIGARFAGGLLARIALYLAYAAVVGFLLSFLVGVAMESMMVALQPTVIMLILFGGPVLLFVSGAAEGTVRAVRQWQATPRPAQAARVPARPAAAAPARPATAAASSAPAAASQPFDPQARLRQLKSLLDQGLISQEEYDEKRGRVLQDL